MSGLSVSVDFERPNIDARSVSQMLSAMAHRGPDGSFVLSVPHAVLGFNLLATSRRHVGQVAPLEAPATGRCIVGDVRLTNRTDVVRALGLCDAGSDVAVVLSAYARWGEHCAERLDGEFAFVIWDPRTRSVYAARDALGKRPLFVFERGSILLFASEVDALLACNEVPRTLDEARFADHLLTRVSDHRRTFFRAIRRIAPGSYLVADRRGQREHNYFEFPTQCATSDETSDVREFRARFERAVESCLDSDHPIVCELSGGLDSSSIAVVGDAMYRKASAPRPPLILASALYPGLPCDESAFIADVHARVKLPWVTWNALALGPSLPARSPLAHPVRSPTRAVGARAGMPVGDFGERVVLTGSGGNEVTSGAGVLVDLARNLRVATLARQAFVPLYGAAPPARRLRYVLSKALPSAVRQPYRVLRQRLQPPLPPPWLGPVLRDHWHAAMREADIPCDPSFVQCQLWALVNSPKNAWFRELNELIAARAGREVRLPFFDRALIEHVVSIPWQRRRMDGLPKRILRDALRDLLPESILSRRRATGFGSKTATVLAPMGQVLGRELLTRADILAPYVRREYLEQLARTPPEVLRRDPVACQEMWKLASSSQWLAAIRG